MNAKDILLQKDEFLTVEEFALLVSFHPKSIYRLVERKQLPGVIRIGRAILIDRTIALQSIPVASTVTSTAHGSVSPSQPESTLVNLSVPPTSSPS